MRCIGWMSMFLCGLFVFGFFMHWVNVKQHDDHVEFHVLTSKIGGDLSETWSWCEGQYKRINRD